jgi:hypothetical protein
VLGVSALVQPPDALAGRGTPERRNPACGSRR